MPFRSSIMSLVAGILLGTQTSVTIQALPLPTVTRQLPPITWTPVGPDEPTDIRGYAVTPAWPDDKLILAFRSDSVVRSVDGGATWETLGPLPATIDGARLIIAPYAGNMRQVFAILGSDV